MGSLFVVVVVLAVLLIVMAAVTRKLRGGGDAGEWPFYARRVLSQPEQVLYHRLRTALPNHIVLAQVGLSRILGVKKGHNFREWLNRIDRMSADFVVCAPDATVVAVIELDDSSHDRQRRKTADAKKDKALGAAGLRVIRWNAKSMPGEADIRAAFVPPAPPAPTPDPAPTTGTRVPPAMTPQPPVAKPGR